jgi:hypothetical protein
VGGESISLSSTQNLEIRTGASQKTSYFENYNSAGKEGIRFNRNITTTKDSDRVTNPYGINLTDLESIFISLEDKTNGLTIENNVIEIVNPSDSEMKIIIPYGTTIPENFFSNFDTYLPTIPKYLFTYSNTGSPISTISSLFNFFNDGKDRNAGVHVLTRDNTDFLLVLNKNDNSAQLRSCNNFENEVNVGGKNLNLYAQNYISIRHAISRDTYCQFRCGINNLHFTNQSDNRKTVTIPYGFNTSIHTLIQDDNTAEKYVNVFEYFEIPMTDDVSKSIIIPYGLNIGLNDTQFTIYNVNENKNIIIQKDLRMVTEDINLHVWRPGTAIESNSNNEIIISYGPRTSIGNNGIKFHKPGDGITDNTSPHQLEFPFDMKLDFDENNFIIRKPGDPTKGVKIPWRPA